MHIAYALARGGGPDAFVATILPWLESQGHKVSLIYNASPQPGEKRFPTSVRVEYITPTPAHYYLAKVIRGFGAWPLKLRAWEEAWAAVKALKKIDRERPIDLVEITEGIAVAPIQRYWPVVIRAHGSDWTVRYFCKDEGFKRDGPLIRSEARQLRRANAVYAISEHLAEHLSSFCRLPRDAMGVLPYPIDSSKFSPASAPKRQQNPSRSVMAIGRLERQKGTDLLVRAMIRVWDCSPDTELRLLGSEAGLKMAQLREMAPAQYRHNIVYQGFVEHDKLSDYYNEASVYVAPSLYETFGYSILEAMACGVPVVASRVGAIPELVEEGKTGLLTPAGDVDALAEAILSLLRDSSCAGAMGEAGHQRAMEYDLAIIGPELESAYKRVLGRHS